MSVKKNHHPKPCQTCGHQDLHGEVAGCVALVSTHPERWCDCTSYVSPTPEPRPARARTSDPETSHAAAASLTVDTLRASQAAVLAWVQSNGPMTDMDLVEGYAAAVRQGGHLGGKPIPRQSPSGLRSRRAELVAGGLVEDTGKRVRLESGRQAIVWEAKA